MANDNVIVLMKWLWAIIVFIINNEYDKCISKFKRIFDLLNEYVTILPMERLDWFELRFRKLHCR